MDDAQIKTDILIIGGGPAGATFARHLVPAGLRVIMLDAGPQFSPRPGQNLKNTFAYQRNSDNFTPIIRGLLHPISVPPASGYTLTLDPIAFRPKSGSIRNALNPKQDPYRNLDGEAAAYSVGGMFLHWTGNTPRHHPKMERIQFISDTEWEGLYTEAEQILNTHTDVYDNSIRNTVVKEALESFYGEALKAPYGVQNLPVAGERRTDNDEFVTFTGVDTILSPIIDSSQPYTTEQFSIKPNHRVKQLVMNGSRVEYALVHDVMTSQTIRIYADTFIVASGGVLSPQLLWASGIRPYALGRYLIEHPIMFTQVVLRQELVDGIQNDPRFKDRVDKIESNDPIPVPMNDPPPMVWIPVSEGRPWHCQIHKDSFHYGQIPPDVDDRLIVDLRWFALIEPVQSNRVKFEDDIHDKFGMPQPTFEFTWSESDRLRIHDMTTDMLEAAQALGGFFPGAEPRLMPSGLCLHVQGTCRMGEKNDDTSVVDPDLYVWGIDNLMVGGNSVIPTANASNPTLTSLALITRACKKFLAKG